MWEYVSVICVRFIVIQNKTYKYVLFRHSFEDVKSITDFLLSKTQYRPTVGVICGSGLGGLVNNVENKEEFAYEDIPGFPISTGEFYLFLHEKVMF